MTLPELLNIYQKKIYFNLKLLQKNVAKLPVGLMIKSSLILLLLFFYPGQNHYQTLTLNPNLDNVKGAQILSTAPIPVKEGQDAPYLTAESAIVFDPDTGTILYQKNKDIPLHPASTTKIMTALVALEVYPESHVFTVNLGSQAVGHSLNLQPQDQFVRNDILKAMLIPSANDAALTVAENYDQGYESFVSLMNSKARELNMKNTHFSNVSGIESFDHKTTVQDLAILAKEVATNPLIMEIVGTKSTSITALNTSNIYRLDSTNELLGVVDGLIGLKTGWTENAGECLVTITERDGKKIITAVLNSNDRFGESRLLIDWAYQNFIWE